MCETMESIRIRQAGLMLGALLLAGCAFSSRVPEEETPPTGTAEALVTWDDFNAEWLAAAIFAETNRVRAKHELPPFMSQVNLVRAAEFQADTVAMLGVASHDNPFAGRRNVMDRVRYAGVTADVVWENVASTSVRAPAEGEFVRVVVMPGGQRIRVNDTTGEPLPWPTYRELAERIVAQFMSSPPHRANILGTEPTRLACATAIGRTATGGEVVHTTQVFMSKKPL